MSLRNEPDNWQFSAKEHFLPIYYKGRVAGYFKEEFAGEITKFLNEENLLKKALHNACIDLVKQSNGDPNQVKEMMKKYLQMSERPKYGTRAIANLLRERQQELDLATQEFTKFCDSFKLSPVDLNNIYAGGQIDNSILVPLSRILGIPKERVIEIRDSSGDCASK